jgi:hypothetical protein
MATIGNMTLEELKQLISQTVDLRLKALFGDLEISDDVFAGDEPEDKRSWDEVRESIKRNRWTPPPGAKSSLDLLREDRER